MSEWCRYGDRLDQAWPGEEAAGSTAQAEPAAATYGGTIVSEDTARYEPIAEPGVWGRTAEGVPAGLPDLHGVGSALGPQRDWKEGQELEVETEQTSAFALAYRDGTPLDESREGLDETAAEALAAFEETAAAYARRVEEQARAEAQAEGEEGGQEGDVLLEDDEGEEGGEKDDEDPTAIQPRRRREDFETQETEDQKEEREWREKRRAEKLAAMTPAERRQLEADHEGLLHRLRIKTLRRDGYVKCARILEWGLSNVVYSRVLAIGGKTVDSAKWPWRRVLEVEEKANAGADALHVEWGSGGPLDLGREVPYDGEGTFGWIDTDTEVYESEMDPDSEDEEDYEPRPVKVKKVSTEAQPDKVTRSADDDDDNDDDDDDDNTDDDNSDDSDDG